MNHSTHRRSSLGLFLAAATAAGLAFATAAHAVSNISNLGTLGAPGQASFGSSINASGEVVGEDFKGSFDSAAFLYTGTPGFGGAMFDLGDFGGTGGGASSINDAHQIVGTADTSNGTRRPFLYTGTPGVNGQLVNLGTLVPGLSTYGIDINSSTAMVGFGNINTTTNNTHAIRINSGGVILDMGTFPFGLTSAAYGINASGQAVGFSSTFTSPSHAFRTIGSSNALVDLGTLPGGSQSTAYDINNAGQVVGRSSTPLSPDHAFRTNVGSDTLVDLGTLPGGNESSAYGIDQVGNVVGRSVVNASFSEHAFLYVGTPGAGGRMIDLDAYLNTTNLLEGAHWTLTSATDINESGLITGYGEFNDGPGGLTDGARAFILDATPLVFRVGDADRDHDVDFTDLLTLAQNYDILAGRTWTTADFTADGAVTFADLLGLAQNYGSVGLTSAESSQLTGDFAADWTLAQTLVPEPTSIFALTVAGTATLRRRR